MTMGAIGETASVAIDELADEGQSVGQLRLRMWRPFPFNEVRETIAGARVLIVLDRAISFGGPGGPVCSEIRSALYNQAKRPKVVSYIGGLGGRDISVDGFKQIINGGVKIAEAGSEQEFEMFGVRE